MALYGGRGLGIERRDRGAGGERDYDVDSTSTRWSSKSHTEKGRKREGERGREGGRANMDLPDKAVILFWANRHWGPVGVAWPANRHCKLNENV